MVDKCTRIDCHEDATMTLNLIVPVGDEGKTYNKVVPYCDNDFGWFYRSFSRASYNVQVEGITILKDLDVEFGIGYHDR